MQPKSEGARKVKATYNSMRRSIDRDEAVTLRKGQERFQNDVIGAWSLSSHA